MADRSPGDEARVSLLVKVPVADAFRYFTEDIDQWWRRGLRYRLGRGRSVLHLEPKLGGRLFESFDTSHGEKVVATGTVTHWAPPFTFRLEWRAVNFAPNEKTEVEVRFDPSPSGTLVTVVHRGFSALRPDHPLRHGESTVAFIRMMGLWWGDLMGSLREHAERGARAST